MKNTFIRAVIGGVAACLILAVGQTAAAYNPPAELFSGTTEQAMGTGCSVRGSGTLTVISRPSGATTTKRGNYMQTLQSGSRGDCVKTLQTVMNIFCAGTPLAVDGQYGSRTARAVTAYQDFFRDYGNSPDFDLYVNGRVVAVDGVAGAQTWVLINTTSWSAMKDKLNCY